MEAFAPGVIERIGSYVYLLIDPRDQSVFYVGKGMGHRCFDHLIEARAMYADSSGDYAKLARIREIEQAGQTVRIEILRHGLTEAEAFLVESTAIDLLGMPTLNNRVRGHQRGELGRMSAVDLNALYGAAPVEILPEHRVVLIRISQQFAHGMSDEALYEATRKWWKIGLERRQLGGPWAPAWAMAVHLGIVRAVYKIAAWEQPNDEWLSVYPTDAPRWGFLGSRDCDMETRYLFGDVSRYLRAPPMAPFSQTPIRYVNCDPNAR